MTLCNLTTFFIVLMAIFSCTRLEDKANQLKEKAASKGKDYLYTAINKLLPESQADSFSVRSIVKDFKDDKNIIEVKSQLIWQIIVNDIPKLK